MSRTPLEYALFLIKIRDRSEFEIRNKMKQRDFSSEDIEKTVKYLIDNKYLNDQKFAERFTENYSKYHLKGKIFIKQKLIRLGIDSEIINYALNQVEDDNSGIKERGQKWLSRKAKIDDDDVKQKLMRHLISQGYSYEEIKGVVDELIDEFENR